MKILIITPYWPPHMGGVEVYAKNMAQGLIAKGWDVVVVTTASNANDKRKSTEEGITIYRLQVHFKLMNTPVGFGWRGKLRKIVKTETPDVINAHTPVPLLADIAERVRGRVPFVLTYHNDLAKDGIISKLLAKVTFLALQRKTLRRAEHVIATSMMYVGKSKALSSQAYKLSIIPPGVDSTRFNTEIKPIKAITNRYAGKQVILFVGGINMSQQHKGLAHLLEAYPIIRKTFPNAVLSIVGSGDGLDYYKNQVKDLGIQGHVHFEGYIPDSDLPSYYQAASALVLPSTNDSEGFGMVAMEASACGTPVIGTTVGGVSAAIQDGQTGLLVSPRSSNEIVSAVNRILADEKYARKLGAAGARRAANFNWNSLTEQYELLMRRLGKPAIAYVAGYYAPHIGGMERVAKTLAEEMAARNYDVRVITSAIDQPTKTDTPTVPGLQVTRLKAFEFAHTPFAFGLLRALFRLPRNSIIHLHLAQAYYPELVWLVARARRQKYVVHFHLDLMPSGPLGALFLVYKSVILRHVISAADSVIVFSEEQRKFLQNKYGLELAKITIIPNGVGEEYFIKQKDFSAKDPFNLLYVGRLTSQKRVGLLIQAMAVLKQHAQLTLVGSGDEAHALKQLADKLQLTNVHFAGYKAAPEIRQILNGSDVFVLSSDREGMPLAVLEAMAAGLPIVATDAPGTRELVSGVGVLVDRADAKEIAKKVDKVLSDRAELGRLSTLSQETAKQFAWSGVVDKCEELYSEVSA